LTSSSTPIDHSDFIDEISPSSTIVGDLAIVEANSSFNWWDFNDTSLSSFPLTSTLPIEDDDWIISNTSLIPSITRFEHLSVDDDNEEINNSDEELFPFTTGLNSPINIDLNDYILSSTLTTTSIIDVMNNKTNDQLLEYMKPLPTLAMPPFSWMLNMAAQSKNESLNTTTTTTTEKQKVQLTSKTPGIFYEYCQNKTCHYDGRLTSDCLCICLPAFTGDNCETGSIFSLLFRKSVCFFSNLRTRTSRCL
jgi:hypothetical protein